MIIIFLEEPPDAKTFNRKPSLNSPHKKKFPQPRQVLRTERAKIYSKSPQAFIKLGAIVTYDFGV